MYNEFNCITVNFDRTCHGIYIKYLIILALCYSKLYSEDIITRLIWLTLLWLVLSHIYVTGFPYEIIMNGPLYLEQFYFILQSLALSWNYLNWTCPWTRFRAKKSPCPLDCCPLYRIRPSGWWLKNQTSMWKALPTCFKVGSSTKLKKKRMVCLNFYDIQYWNDSIEVLPFKEL